MILYAWYSPTCARLYGGSIYQREDGSQVHVTDASQTNSREGNEWPDLVFVGEVVTWVRNFPGQIDPRQFHRRIR